MILRKTDPSIPEVRALLARHLAFTSGESPPESQHALGIDGLADPSVTLFGAWEQNGDGAELLGIGALKQLDLSHGEIKSMHTAERHRGRGVAAAMVAYILDEARRRSYRQVSLETGSMASFKPARDLYSRHGFVTCPPFAAYRPDPNSVFMTLALPATAPSPGQRAADDGA